MNSEKGCAETPAERVASRQGVVRRRPDML